MALIHNERTKLGTYRNGVAIAVFAIGALAPLVSCACGANGGGGTRLAVSGGCLALSGTMHWLARFVLGRLHDD